jgi:hypothetical protein
MTGIRSSMRLYRGAHFPPLRARSVLVDAPKSKNAKVTLVYQHELPNVPGKSMMGVLVEYGPGGHSVLATANVGRAT